MKYDRAKEMIIAWGGENLGKVLEIYVIGSLAIPSTKKNAKKKSDLDLVVFISDLADQDLFYQDLASIGLSTGVLIHPLFIRESEKRSKLSIALYSDALEKGIRVF